MKQNADDKMLGKVTNKVIKINIAAEENRDKSTNINKLFMNTDKSDSRSKLFIGRQSKKETSSEVNQLFRTDFKPRNLDSSQTLKNKESKKFAQEAPLTTLEKIVNIMKKIKDKLNEHKEIELATETEWIVKEILSNNIYKLKFDDKDGDSQFFDEYSNIKSEKLFNKDVMKSGKLFFI